MPQTFFQFKKFIIHQDRTAMKVTTDGCLFGAWVAKEIEISSYKNLLDIGTGTALLSLMIAQKNDLKIDAVEIDNDAAQQAQENVNLSPWGERIKVINGDILNYPGQQYDCIISNPPFYEKELSSPYIKKNIAHHSEQLKLHNLVNKIKELLAPAGSFYLLLPPKREKEFEVILQTLQFNIAKKVHVRQKINAPVFRIMYACTLQRQEVKFSDIEIREDDHNYSAAFKDLLSDYYLYL